MQGGDIGNTVVPRLVIVFENLLGLHPTKASEAKFGSYMRFKRYKRAVDTFEINEQLARRIWDITVRMNFSVDLVTHLGGTAFAEALQERIDGENLPLGHIWYEDSTQLARNLAYRIDIAAVFFADPRYTLTYGSKGRLISASHPDIIGAF
jgi:hypothetical protein